MSEHVPGLTEGRIVHYVLPNGDHRPAMVVKSWEGIVGGVCMGYANLQVFTDGSNDVASFGPGPFTAGFLDNVKHGHFWATSICMDNEKKKPGTYHWVESA